ncbi:MAG: hypothetical protein WC620_10000 [Methanoregula sp.]
MCRKDLHLTFSISEYDIGDLRLVKRDPEQISLNCLLEGNRAVIYRCPPRARMLCSA